VDGGLYVIRSDGSVNDGIPTKYIGWNNPNIQRMIAYVDNFLVLTTDGRLWANSSEKDPKIHYNMSCVTDNGFYELDISSQQAECKSGNDIENIVSDYEGLFMLLGTVPRNELALMKIWKREAFVDVIIRW
jgi:hypothetical protein